MTAKLFIFVRALLRIRIMGYGTDGATDKYGDEYEATPGTLVIHVVIGVLLALLLGYGMAQENNRSVMQRIGAFAAFGVVVAGMLAFAVYLFSKLKPIANKAVSKKEYFKLAVLPFGLFMMWFILISGAAIIALLPILKQPPPAATTTDVVNDEVALHWSYL